MYIPEDTKTCDLTEANLSFPKDLDKLTEAIDSFSGKYSFMFNEIEPIGFNTISTTLEDIETLKTFIVYLSTNNMVSPSHFYFMVNLLNEIAEKNQKVASNLAKLEEAGDQLLSFNNLKEKAKKTGFSLMPSSTFLKLLVAHKEWLKVLEAK